MVVHHKPNWQLDREHVREQQPVATARFVERLLDGRADVPVILMGDFDAAPDVASIRFFTGKQSLGGMSVRYEDAWETLHGREGGETFTPRNPLVRDGEMPLERGRRIDYIIVPPSHTARYSKSPTAGSSSTSRSDASGRVTTSACSPTCKSRRVH